MDLTACTMTTHGLIPASLQPAPGLNGRTAILCPAKSGPWETIVTHIPHHPPPPCILSSPPPPLPTEIPKESIIANTDFTTTSLIAKRRLSSKKRRQQQQQQQLQSHGLSSPNKESHSRLSDDTSNRSVTTTIPTTSPPSSHSSSTLTHPVPSSMNGISTSHVMAVPAPQYVHVPITASMGLPHNNTVLQLPHQYQLVQQQDTTNKQVLYCKNVSEDSSVSQQQPQSQANKSTTSKDFKWSNAHVFIAKRIQEHQKQLRLQEQQKLQHQQHIEQQKIHQQRIDQQALHHMQQQQQQLLQLQQQQQQYALLHVYGYGHHPTPTTANFITLPDIHQQQPLCVSGLPLVQPPSSQVLGLVPQGLGHQTGGMPLTLAPPTDLQAYIASQGMGGSWVGPTVPIVGSCVVNPLQPAATGLLATTSWVK
ncbi:PREDICTED: ras-interacting protein RIP3-like [Amphimedon queenslandica]|uniref:Uncharacterized protein n=1 Tax=Amphimedon queenslandica TaxID=400682 RepID=A0A1X7VKT7_AMPQE|nr:PREDICTED: ras-interacting protein RIP3-like [Amphimedon queenslandica]|eukprot:XP_019848707.1 PREDICTED: ras-interacting protein RIP3-like [Amphimedon queenslandica]